MKRFDDAMRKRICEDLVGAVVEEVYFDAEGEPEPYWVITTDKGEITFPAFMAEVVR